MPGFKPFRKMCWMQSIPETRNAVLGLASINYEGLKASLAPKASNVRMVKVDNSGHFFPEEQPEVTARELSDFFTGS